MLQWATSHQFLIVMHGCIMNCMMAAMASDNLQMLQSVPTSRDI